MIVLAPHSLHWIEGGIPEQDLCAHGNITIQIHDAEINTEGDGCVSAAAMFLLRSLKSNHNATERIGDNLFPHCGHTMWIIDGQEDVLIMECSDGFDWHVEHVPEVLQIRLSFGEQVFTVSFKEWRDAVCQFADAVNDFYVTSGKKIIPDSPDGAGFIAFRKEWAARREAASSQF